MQIENNNNLRYSIEDKQLDIFNKATWPGHSIYKIALEAEKAILNGDILKLSDSAILNYEHAANLIISKRTPNDPKRHHEEMILKNIFIQKFKKIKEHNLAIQRAEKEINKAINKYKDILSR